MFGIQSKLPGNVFHGVDGSSVNTGLAGFAQSAISHLDAEARGTVFRIKLPLHVPVDTEPGGTTGEMGGRDEAECRV